MSTTTAILMGRVPVDSGTLCVVDPCYLTDAPGHKRITDEDRMSDGDFAFADQYGTGHIFGGFGGDGLYPLGRFERDGRTIAVAVVFDRQFTLAVQAHDELVACLSQLLNTAELNADDMTDYARGLVGDAVSVLEKINKDQGTLPKAPAASSVDGLVAALEACEACLSNLWEKQQWDKRCEEDDMYDEAVDACNQARAALAKVKGGA